MARVPTHARPLVVSAALTCLSLGSAASGCGSRGPSPSPPRSPPAAASALALAITPVGSVPPRAAPRKPDVCASLAPGQISDEDTPSLRGGTGELLTAFEWLEARGVGHAAALAWYVGRFRADTALDANLAEVLFGGARCREMTVGDRNEEAVVCEHALSYSFAQARALVLVVRNKRPVPVLDLGLGMRALDFPDVRHLDLALRVAADGKTAELRERAPEGSTLVEPPSSCREREAALDACETALASGAPPLPSCPIVTRGGTQVVARDVKTPFAPFPANVHGCAWAREELARVARDVGPSPGSFRKEVKDATAFVERSCKERGAYAWKGDRFVRVGD